MRFNVREAKRKLALFIILALAVLLFSACSESLTGKDSDIAANQSPPSVIITDDPVAAGELPDTVSTDTTGTNSPLDPTTPPDTSPPRETTSSGEEPQPVEASSPGDTAFPSDTAYPSDGNTPEETASGETPLGDENQSEEPPVELPQSLIIAPPEIDIPVYSGSGAYIVINGNIPFFTESNLTTIAFEHYSDLDSLGRCGFTFANICRDIMPTEPRGSIGQVKPTGWQTVKYDIVEGKYLYNRCHLIGFQLSAENANTRNLITGTRYLNVQGMLPFENMVADYVKETNKHVLYRVTPLFNGNDLVAAGVLIEAFSVEDEGEGICFNVFCYNVQPGITVDYSTGTSVLTPEAFTYILNSNTHKFHFTTCYSVMNMRAENKKESTGDRDEILADGYTPCGICKP